MLLTDADQLREARAFSAELESHVRRLARERDEARKYAEERNDEANKLQRFLNMAAQERDKARAALAGAEASLTAEREHSARLSRECQERHDELRAEVERLRGVVERLQHHYAELVRISCLSVAERQREACAVTVEKNVDDLMLRKGLAEDVRDTPLVTEEKP